MATRPLPTAPVVEELANASAPAPLRLSEREPYGDRSAENLLIHGDNLRALQALLPRFANTIACAYIDPPFNTGRTFAEYSDVRLPSQWLAMMRSRLEALRPLLRQDGSVFVEIDDTMLADLTVLMDEVFGRPNRVSTTTIVRSASTGHKAKNRGPVNVTDFLLIYEKTRGFGRYYAQHRVRQGYDSAYRTWLVNPADPMQSWQFIPLAQAVANSLGHATALRARQTLGAVDFERRTVDFALAHVDNVVRFAQPRFEAVSRKAQALIALSRQQPGQVFRLVRPRHPDLLLRAGNRILFLKNKVKDIDGAPRIVEPLTNVWDDIGFQGIAKEGGVVFARNKKPERLVARVLAMATLPGDWVLDPFLGSGTTAAVAHKLGRRWIGIEEGDQLWKLCLPRLLRVVGGKDATGITGASGWTKGGGFAVLT